MHLIQITVDGFKSYAKRTDITGFDREFNAITGGNGHGKSNVLDAICFVLGISNLSQVRAPSWRGCAGRPVPVHNPVHDGDCAFGRLGSPLFDCIRRRNA